MSLFALLFALALPLSPGGLEDISSPPKRVPAPHRSERSSLPRNVSQLRSIISLSSVGLGSNFTRREPGLLPELLLGRVLRNEASPDTRQDLDARLRLE